MDIPLGKISLPAENIFDFRPEDVIDVFAFKKFAMQKLKELGYAVLPAGDMESAMLRHFHAGRPVYDRYLRTKLGKKPQAAQQEREYAAQLLEMLGSERVRQLMLACRFSSYLGGPGPPDFIALKEKPVIFYVGSEFLQQQELFMLLAQVLDFDMRVLPVGASEFSLDSRALLGSLLSQEKTARHETAIRDALAALRQEVPTKQLQDAVSYLEEEKAIMPFDLLRKWVAEGAARKEDLLLLFERIEYIVAKHDREFGSYIKQLAADPAYRAFGPARDEAAMRKKAAYLEEKLGICDVKAKDLLNFV